MTHSQARSHAPTFGLCLQQLSRQDFHVLSFIKCLTVSKPLFNRGSSSNTTPVKEKPSFITEMNHCFKKNQVEQHHEIGRRGEILPQCDALCSICDTNVTVPNCFLD